MAWQPLKPAASDIKKISQGDIQGNFYALDNVYNGINNFIKLNEQGAAPATAVSQMALYTKAVAGVSALFLRNENSGTEVDMTTAGKTTTGWFVLPCGIIVKFGKSSNKVAPNTDAGLITVAKGGIIPPITTVLGAILTPDANDDKECIFSYLSFDAGAQEITMKSYRAVTSTTKVYCWYLIIGI